ncbi:hypothetical protein GCM10022378_09100 [Salinicoccus jeotgali]|uniref:Uncharacterized protein n=1 Tax=Salinicoccus jeotgali TaxID=381634 RepID=A0ABP7ELX6_9STAP
MKAETQTLMTWLSTAQENLFSKNEENYDFGKALDEFIYDNQHAQASCHYVINPIIVMSTL